MTSSVETPAPLEGTSWTATTYDDGRAALVEPLAGTEITARFAEGRVMGSSGCNRYTASCSVVGSTIAISEAAGTRMACLEPPGTMAQETAFLAALATARLYRIEGNQLTLESHAGSPVVTFVRAASAAIA